MGKYTPLTAYLAGNAPRQVRLSFAEIEEILGFPLPASKRHQAWWSNSPSNNTMTAAWLDAGYATSQVDIVGQRLTFAPVASARADAPSLPRSPLFGSMKGTTFVMPGVDLTAPTDIDDARNDYDSEDVVVRQEVEKVKADTSLNVSQKIRTLARMGLPRAEIARQLGKRYQHVRNVLVADEHKAA